MQEISMKRLLFCLSFVSLISVQRVDAQQTFTVEQVLSAPFPANLTASKTGERLAWTLDEQGRRNIWAAEGPEAAVFTLIATKAGANFMGVFCYGSNEGLKANSAALTSIIARSTGSRPMTSRSTSRDSRRWCAATRPRVA
jgi:hypothetical protein